jgi:hypothetical protein
LSYKALYEFCQDKQVPISRAIIQPKVFELAGVPYAKVFYDGKLPQEHLRGYFVSAQNQDHPLIKLSGGLPVIVIQRDLTYPWKRFVWIKELMHLFDTPLEFTSSGAELLTIITGLTSPELIRSPQLRSEVICFWRAIGVICPEAKRQEYVHRREQGEELTDAMIADELKIPEQYIERLFHPQFKAIISKLISNGPEIASA